MNPLLRRWISLCFAAILALFTLYHLTDVGRAIDFGPGNRAPNSLVHGPIDWKTIAQHYPLPTFTSLPTGTPVKIPKVQADFLTESADRQKERLNRRDAVKDAFIHSWRGYTKYAW
jgi:mannosyl-oligosaccharide alpha-1,2-mannosidase